MKRREFVTASLLALLAGSSARAAPPVKQATKPAVKSAKKTPAKPGAKKPAAKPRPAVAAAAQKPPEANAPRNAISLPDEPPPQWRNYELRTTIALKEADGKLRLWLPLIQYRDTAWERSFGHRWRGNYEMAAIYRDPVTDMEVFYADWLEGAAKPELEIISGFATQDRHFDITRRSVSAERTEILRRCLQATKLAPIDGIVRLTAERAVGRIKDPLAQAKAIYDWVIENTSYTPRPQTTDPMNIADFLESGHLTGRSIEISQLFVGLCRSVGIPARPVFGLRMDRSRLFDSLGVSGELNFSRHCRAEFYSPGYGWVPANPSDVGQAVLGENLSRYDPKLSILKKLLFGFWEMNWVAFNTAQDVTLQGMEGDPLPFLVTPVVETPAGRFGDPAFGHFSCSVSAHRV